MSSSSKEELLDTFFRHGHHEGIVVTLNEDNSPNAAPMGVDLKKPYLLLKPYLTTKTYVNLRVFPELTINLTWDSMLFYKSLYGLKDLRFKDSRKVKTPVIEGNIDLYVEGRALKILENRGLGYAEVLVEPLDAYTGSGSRLAYSRADALLIEVMIYLTKAEAFAEVNPEVASILVERVQPHLLTAERLGSDELREIALELRSKFMHFKRD